MKTRLLLFLCFLTGSWVYASDIVEVLPLTKRVIMLHFDDGYARHEARGENINTANSLVVSRLNTGSIGTGSFSITSSNDPNFSTARNASNVWRKRRGTDLIRIYNASNTYNTDDYAAYEHWIYLNMPFDIVEGRTYTVSWSSAGLNTNVGSVTFTFDSKNIRSEAIHVNIVGFSPNSPKYAYLSHWMGDGDAANFSAYNNQPFKVLRASDKVEVFSGTITFRKSKDNQETLQPNESLRNNFVGSDVYQCNFSSLTTAGTYIVSVPNLGCSFPFVINAEAYSEPFFWGTKSIFENRSGIALSSTHTTFPRSAPHNPGVTPGFSGRLKYTTVRGSDVGTDGGGAAEKATIESGFRGTLNTFGWYQDAGDWDGYLSHTKVPAYLMLAYEANPSRWTSYGLNIPESGGNLPDILDEARWLLRYLKRTKDEIVSKGWGTGGVAGTRVFGDYWGADTPNGILRGSWQDTDRDWYVMGEDPWSSYKFAGLAAQFAKILQDNGLTDPEGINWRTEAINAYNWARNNTRAGDDSKSYEGTLAQTRLYAAGALFRLTGEAGYQTQFTTDLPTDFGDENVLWGVHNFLRASGANASTVTTVMNRLNAKVDEDLVNSAESRGMRFGDTRSMPMLIGQATTPRIWYGVIGYIANKDRGNTAKVTSYFNAISTTADYFLGGNPLNQCWVSGVGERSPLGVFHLDWFASDNLYVNGPGGNRKDIRPKRGFIPYGIWRTDRSDWGWWSPVFGHKTAYPSIPVNGVNTGTACPWPGHEMYFDDRNAPLPAENTIHQTQGPSALIYGFLYAVATGGTTPPPPPPTGLINGGIYELAPTHALGMRLDVNAASSANGANVQIWTANGSSAQRWKLFDIGSGVYELEPQCAIGKRLDVVGWGTTNGTNVDIWQDVDQANERWKLIDVGSGNYELEPQNALGKRLDVNNWGTTDGSNVQIWQDGDQANQRWKLTLISSARMSASLEDKTSAQLLVYPNPNQGGAFQISLPESHNPRFTLTNSIGQTIPVSSQQLGDGHYQLTPKSNLSSGLYFVRIKTGDNEQVTKMVVR